MTPGIHLLYDSERLPQLLVSSRRRHMDFGSGSETRTGGGGKLAPIAAFFVLGLLSLFISNLLGSFAIATAHAVTFLYERGPPGPRSQRIIDAVIHLAQTTGPLVNWTVVFLLALFWRYRAKRIRPGHFISYLVGAWLAVLPFTLQPQHPEMHAVVPQMVRFAIVSAWALCGLYLGTWLRRRSARHIWAGCWLRRIDSRNMPSPRPERATPPAQAQAASVALTARGSPAFRCGVDSRRSGFYMFGRNGANQ